MFKQFFKKLFKKTSIKKCRLRTPKLDYIYFTNKDNERLEEFFGEDYDYDFADYGVMVWEEQFYLNHIAWRLCPRYFQYNTYIVKEVTEDGYFIFKGYSKKDFENKYEPV